MSSRAKENALNQAYLAAMQAQTAVYGATIAQYYGRTRGNPLWIWFNGLREGKGLGGKKSTPKGQTNYIANVDFLIGNNPIAGVLKVWWGNQSFPLLYDKYTAAITYPIGNSNGHLTVPDASLYFILGVTANVAYDETFNDYGGQGSRHLAGTFEMPLWNMSYRGPNSANPNGYRQWPASFKWQPFHDGATVQFPAGSVSDIPGADGTVNVYYAKADPGVGKSVAGAGIPLGAVRLSFEPLLGAGSEYDDFPADRRVYQSYAGVNSPDLDMGTSGVPAPLLTEVVGSFPTYATGDADYADMIEDIFTSGFPQASIGGATPIAEIHHGLGCYEFPGTVQKKIINGGVEPWCNTISFDLPNAPGNLLFVELTQNALSPSTVGITDTAANTWIPLMPVSATSKQLWYCVANGSNPGTTITFTNYDRFLQVAIFEVAGFDTVESVTAAAGSGPISQTITPTNKPGEDALLLSFVVLSPGSGTSLAAPFHWSSLVNFLPSFPGSSWLQADYYRTKTPGTYTITYPFGGGAHWQIVTLALKNSQPNAFTAPLGNILDDTTMQLARLAARAYGLYGSLVMDSQKKASDWLEELYRVMNAAPVWSGDKLKSIPAAEQSAVGNGAIYVSPTAAGPIANLSESDFMTEENDPPVTITRVAQVDVPNLQQIQSPNRDSDYNQVVTSQPDNGAISLYGTRKDSPKTFLSIQTTAVARMILGIMVREANIVRNSFEFKLKAKWGLLEAMDLITIPVQSTMPAVDPSQPVSGTIALRLTSVEVEDDHSVSCVAEPFIYGLRTPVALDVTTPAPYSPSYEADPGNVNTPIFVEDVPPMANRTNEGQLSIVVSAPSPDYGGCICYMSTDGGASYQQLGPNQGLISGNATTGVTVGDWPAHADPDTTNDLAVNLTECLGVLESYAVADEDNFLYPIWVDGGGANPITYELGAYALANLTAAHMYTLKATGGNHLRRAVFGAPASGGAGVDHPNGSRFAFLDRSPNAPGILRVVLNPSWVGVALKFKFQAFNTLFGGLQDLSALTVYTYTPSGAAGGVNPAGIPPQLFEVN